MSRHIDDPNDGESGVESGTDIFTSVSRALGVDPNNFPAIIQRCADLPAEDIEVARAEGEGMIARVEP